MVMNRLLALILGVIVTIPAAQSTVAADGDHPDTAPLSLFERYDEPRPLPPIGFKTGAGEAIGVDAFAGKVVLLNFWATWCAPCVREMPTLDALQRLRGGDTFEVVALSFDRQGVSVVEEFYQRRRIENLAIYVDDGLTTWKAMGVSQLPITYVLDGEGRALGELLGAAEWDSPDALALIDGFTGAPVEPLEKADRD